MPEVMIGDKITTNLIKGFGSVGCFLKPQDSPKLDGTYLLTNGHVIADDGYRICLGGNTKVKKSEEEIGTVYKAMRQWDHKHGWVDWALCKLKKGVAYSNDLELGSKWTDPKDSARVYKTGARTGATKGTVEATDDSTHLDYLPDYPTHVPPGKGLVNIRGTNFCLKGDSGSVIYDDSKKIIALLFASDQLVETYGIPFRRILDSLYSATKTKWKLTSSGTA